LRLTLAIILAAAINLVLVCSYEQHLCFYSAVVLKILQSKTN